MKIADIVNKLKKNITDNEGVIQQGRFVPRQAVPMMRQVVNAYNNSPIPFTPRIQQGGVNVPKAIFQPMIKTAQPIINYLDPRGYQAERMNPSLGPQKLTSAIKAMPMTAANIYGASRLTPISTALSGALGGVFSKATGGTFKQGVESGLGAAPSLSAIGSFSNPLINKTVGMAASRFTAPVSNFIANRAVTGLANIPEGYVMGKALDRKNYKPQDAALDFAFGATFGSRISGKPGIKVKGFTTKGMHPEDVRELTTILAKSKGMKSSLDTQMKYGKTIDTLAERYLDTPKNIKTMSFTQKVNALNERRSYDFNTRGLSMGLVDGKKIPIHNRNDRTNMNPDRVLIDLEKGISETPPINNRIGSSQNPLQSASQTQSQTPFSKQSSLRESITQDTRGILTGDQVKQRGFTTTLKFSDKTPKQLRDMVSGTYVVKSNTQLKRDAQQLIRDNPDIAEQVALNPKTDTHVQIGNELIAHYGSTGNFTKARQIADGMSESGTELGRAVHAFSQYDKTTPSGALKFAQSKVKEYNTSHPNKKLNINDDQVKSIFDRAHKIQGMPEGRERNIASNDLINEVNNLIPSTIVDKFVTVWKAGLLTSLRTHERNLLGNTIHGAAEVIKDIPASIADRAMALRTGSRSMVLTTQGSAQGARKGLTAAKDLITKGYDPDEAINKFDIRHVTWGNNKFEQGLKIYTDTVFRTLGATDKIYWNSSFARSLYNQAKTGAINAGRGSDEVYIKNLFDNPSDVMLQVAKNDANISTFKNENVLSKVIVNAKNVLSKNEYTKFISELVAPFTGVPSAIAGQFVAYSPIGLIKGVTNAGRVVAGNVPDLQRQAAHEIGRGVMGTGLFGIGAYLSSIGLMTGQPKDLEESKQWEIEGKQANSVFIDGKWRSIGSVGPELLVVLAGAKAQEELSDPEGSFGQYAGNLGKDFLGQTFLQGVQQPIAAINDPNRYGKNYVGGQVSSVIPNIIKDTSRALDGTQRESNDISDYMTNSIPGFRNTGIEKRDNLGNVLKQEPTGVGAFIDLFNSKTPIKTPISNELMRLHEAGYSATPSKLKKDQTIGKKKMVLTPSQLNTLEAAIQPELETNLNALIQHPTYPALSDADKKEKIDKVIQDTRKAVRKDINLNKIDDFTFQQYDEAPKNTSDKLKLFARGMTLDPKNSIKALITDEEMRKITGDAMILKRRNDLNMTTNKLDARNHTIPLSLGGDNSEMNLKYMSEADHAARTPYETELYNKLNNGEIKRKEAQKLITDWRGNTTTAKSSGEIDELVDKTIKKTKSKETTSKENRQAALVKEIKGTRTTKSNSDVDSLIRKHFPQSEWDTARAVMMAESGGNPGAKGDDYPINGLHAPSYGLFQIRHLEGRPGPDVLLNAEENIKYAAQMQRTQGWGPWTGYTSGNYKQYLGGKGTFSGELASNESRALTQKQNDIEELFKNGQLTQSEATSAWEKLQSQKNTLKVSTKGKGKKSKKMAMKKVTIKKVSVRAPGVTRFKTKIRIPKVTALKMNTRVSQPKKLNIKAMVKRVSKTA